MTSQQCQILSLVMGGLTNAEIARHVGLSEKGVKYHLTQIYSLKGVSGRLGLGVKLRKRGARGVPRLPEGEA